MSQVCVMTASDSRCDTGTSSRTRCGMPRDFANCPRVYPAIGSYASPFEYAAAVVVGR